MSLSLISDQPSLSYDDVLLVPRQSSIYSRKQVSLRTRLVNDIEMDCPIISANMSSVTELEMALALEKSGGLGIIHRFLSPVEQIRQLQQIKGIQVLSIGVGSDSLGRVHLFGKEPAAICIDVAHGDHVRVADLISELADEFPETAIIAGNVCTAQAVYHLLNAGANAIKVGIGGGSVCKTRQVAGVGVAQLTAVLECRAAIDHWWETESRKSYPAQDRRPTLIADGSIKTSGDCVKALAAGADSIMIGKLFAGCPEAPGDRYIEDGRYFKKYSGMASFDAQQSIGIERLPEGVSVLLKETVSAENVVRDLSDGIRSGMSYLNCKSIADMHLSNIQMRRITESGWRESIPHAELDQ